MITSFGNIATEGESFQLFRSDSFHSVVFYSCRNHVHGYVSVISLSFYSPIIIPRSTMYRSKSILWIDCVCATPTQASVFTFEHYTKPSNLLFYCVSGGLVAASFRSWSFSCERTKVKEQKISLYCGHYFKKYGLFGMQFKWFKFTWNDCCLFCLPLLKSHIQ